MAAAKLKEKPNEKSNEGVNEKVQDFFFINDKNKNDSGWSCIQCTLENSSHYRKCRLCNADRTFVGSAQELSEGERDEEKHRAKLMANDPFEVVLAGTKWDCGSCTVRNEWTTTLCDMCLTGKPNITKDEIKNKRIPCMACETENLPTYSRCVKCNSELDRKNLKDKKIHISF